MADYLWLWAGGVFFFIIGLLLLAQGRREEKGYYGSLMQRNDAREFLVHWPPRPRVGAIKAGGWTSLAVSLGMIVLGVLFFTQYL